MEFYLADPKAVDGALSSPFTGAAVTRDGGFSLDDLDDFETILTDIYDACKIQSVAADAAISESGLGQFEVNLRHGEDAMKVADDAMLFKTSLSQLLGNTALRRVSWPNHLVTDRATGCICISASSTATAQIFLIMVTLRAAQCCTMRWQGC